MSIEVRWRTYTQYLKNKYGHSVYRIGIDGGFSCPNREKDRSGGCAFCDGTGASATYFRTEEGKWKRSSSFVNNVASQAPRKVLPLEERLISIENQINKGKAFLKRRYNVDDYSLYFQAWTSTYSSIEDLRKIYDKGLSLYPFTEFIVSTRPDCLDDDVIDLLASYKNKVKDVWVEVGLQSANDETLKLINRGHDSKVYLDRVRALHNKGLKVSTHIITGLPGETEEDLKTTVDLVNEAGSEGIKIHNLDICGGTALYEQYIKGGLSVPSNARALEYCMFVIRRINPEMIVQRLICETPPHRLAAPRGFNDKSLFIKKLNNLLEQVDGYQGDLFNNDRIRED